ncbi:MAG: LysM peptidoglycan-binding domain-containing protein [Anaerosomatales bacterium]|nr:LysM peptidoglycan-binding domain-containing protein [Anaerosomatales bacterium]
MNTARTRATLIHALGAALSLALLLAAIAHAGVTVAPDAGTTGTVVVVVRPGDTLWSIARRCDVPGRSMPEKVAAIRAANDLATAVIRPGQTLVVPVMDDQRRVAQGLTGDRIREAPQLETR